MTTNNVGDHVGDAVMGPVHREERYADGSVEEDFMFDSQDQNIEELELSVRAYNSLRGADIRTIGELVNYSAEELLLVPEGYGFSKRTIREIQGVLRSLGIALSKIRRKSQQKSYFWSPYLRQRDWNTILKLPWSRRTRMLIMKLDETNNAPLENLEIVMLQPLRNFHINGCGAFNTYFRKANLPYTLRFRQRGHTFSVRLYVKTTTPPHS